MINRERSYFDNHIYLELKSFIYGDSLLPEKPDIDKAPSFDSVVEKINSFALRRDLRARIILETLGQVLSELNDKTEAPPFLMVFLCRETAKSLTLRKFNRILGCECVDLLSLSHKIGDNIAEANRVFTTIRICDPFMRTGTFMTTMLNELIVIKSQLGLLVDRNGNPLYRYKFVSDSTDNGLHVFDKKDSRIIQLDGSTPESRHIQQALFDEKVTLIHQCLFGVCADPLSLLTCKLRLWLEAIIHLDGMSNSAFPSIENNLIYGDALASRFTLKDDLFVALKDINQTVAGYRQLAENIKTTGNAANRQYLSEQMTLIKNRLIEGIGWCGKDTDELLRLRREISKLMMPGLFPLSDKEKLLQQERVLLLQTKINNREKQISTFRNHPAFEKAVEWRYVFPELLDEKGDFIGFDAMFGMLPDAIMTGIGREQAGFYKRLNYKVFSNTGNVADLYCELVGRLLVREGCMTCIMPSNWRRDVMSNKIGAYLSAEMNPLQLILFDEIASPHELLKDKCALIAQKDINHHRTVMCRIDSSYHPKTMDLDAYLRHYSKPAYRLVETDEPFGMETVSTVMASQDEYLSISNKIKRNGLMIRNWDVKILSGVMTGCDKAFVINRQTRDEMVRADNKYSDIIKPLLTGSFIKRYGDETPEHWLLNIPWHFPLHFDKTINTASAIAEQRFQIQYPDIYAHLLKFKEALSLRHTGEAVPESEWYAMQHFITDNTWSDFAEQKIVWKRELSDFSFGFDYGRCVILDDAFFMVGQHLKYLLGVLNSTMGRFMLSDRMRQSINESQAGITIVESIAVPAPNNKVESDVISLVNRRISENSKSNEIKKLTDGKIDRMIFELYGLTENEITFIKSQTE